jgi:hypothetical protein
MTALKHQKEKRGMDHFAGLDVSVKETSVCIVNRALRHAISAIALTDRSIGAFI